MRIVFTLLALLSARPAVSCDCVLPSVKEEVKRSEIIFRGVVTKIDDSQITFAVQRVFKGRLPARFAMPKLTMPAPCSPGFSPELVKAGSDLLVYAWRADFFPEGLLTSTCSRTELIESASEDLRKLGKGHPPTTPRFKNSSDRDYLAPLLDGVALTPNFASQFRVVRFRMGDGPIGAVVVDSNDGSVFRLPTDVVRDEFFIHNTDCLSAYRGLHSSETGDEQDDSAPLSFKTDSELLTVRQCRMDGRAVTAIEHRYYRWHDRKWRLLQHVSAPPPLL